MRGPNLCDRDGLRSGRRLRAARVAAHAVGNDEQVALYVAPQDARARQARLGYPQRLRQLGDDEVVLVLFAHLAAVGLAARGYLE